MLWVRVGLARLSGCVSTCERIPLIKLSGFALSTALGQNSVRELKKAYTHENDDGTDDCFMHVIDCTGGIDHDVLGCRD